MNRRYCDTGRIECPHLPECTWDCAYDNATVRKVKPYPAIPEDIEPVPDTWHTVGTLMLAGAMGVIVICFLLVFFTGVWIWSLLI